MGRSNDYIEDYLAHHGVKGMRWGVRRKRTSSGSGVSGIAKGVKQKLGAIKGKLQGKKKKKVEFISEDVDKVRKINKKKIKEMSNRDLETVLKRYDLEARYNKIYPDRATRIKNTINKAVKLYNSLPPELKSQISSKADSILKAGLKKIVKADTESIKAATDAFKKKTDPTFEKLKKSLPPVEKFKALPPPPDFKPTNDSNPKPKPKPKSPFGKPKKPKPKDPKSDGQNLDPEVENLLNQFKKSKTTRKQAEENLKKAKKFFNNRKAKF